MTPEQFVYWLQGFIELHEGVPTAAQWKSIGEHLAAVFVKVTPPVGQPATAEQSKRFEEILRTLPRCASDRTLTC